MCCGQQCIASPAVVETAEEHARDERVVHPPPVRRMQLASCIAFLIDRSASATHEQSIYSTRVQLCTALLSQSVRPIRRTALRSE